MKLRGITVGQGSGISKTKLATKGTKSTKGFFGSSFPGVKLVTE
jgi:hypothetical protein